MKNVLVGVGFTLMLIGGAGMDSANQLYPIAVCAVGLVMVTISNSLFNME